MYISVTLIHSSKCIESHSRRRWEEVILKSVKRQIGYTSDTYPLLVYYKYCREISSQSSEISLMTFLIFYTTVSFYAIKSHLKTLHSTSHKAAIKMNYSLCQTAALELKELKECADVLAATLNFYSNTPEVLFSDFFLYIDPLCILTQKQWFLSLFFLGMPSSPF